MKNICKIVIFTVIIGSSLLFAFTAYDADNCRTHTYSEWETISSANCTKAGQQKRICSECKYPQTRNNPNDPAWGHTPNFEKGICTVCDGFTYKIGDTGPGGGKLAL